MNRLVRCLGAVLVGSGWLSLGLSLETVGAAVDCEPMDYSPAECISAHEIDGGSPGSAGGCYLNSFGECRSQGDCGGDTGYGIVVKGRCKMQPATSNPSMCTENVGITVVELHHWVSSCQLQDGVCKCVLEADHSGPSVNVQVCDCRSEEI